MGLMAVGGINEIMHVKHLTQGKFSEKTSHENVGYARSCSQKEKEATMFQCGRGFLRSRKGCLRAEERFRGRDSH